MNKFRLLISMTMLLLSFIAVAGPGKREWSCKEDNHSNRFDCVKDGGLLTFPDCTKTCGKKKNNQSLNSGSEKPKSIK